MSVFVSQFPDDETKSGTLCSSGAHQHRLRAAPAQVLLSERACCGRVDGFTVLVVLQGGGHPLATNVFHPRTCALSTSMTTTTPFRGC